jgi:hypothetical protein
MNASETPASNDERRWRVSGRSSPLRLRAWALAVAVVAMLALGLAWLHG